MIDSQPRYGRHRSAVPSYLREKHGLNYTETTMANMAGRGTGPLYRIVAGRAYYLDTDLDDWASSRISSPVRLAADRRRVEITGAAA